MPDGLPENEKTLHDLLKRLRDALNSLALQFGASAPYDLSGVRVYFSQDKTDYRLDDDRVPSLFLNNNFSQHDIDKLVRPMLRT